MDPSSYGTLAQRCRVEELREQVYIPDFCRLSTQSKKKYSVINIDEVRKIIAQPMESQAYLFFRPKDW